jgi:UPF0176 protein
MIANIAGYKFIPLIELNKLQSMLLAKAVECHCLGTILLSAEGINLSLAATPEDMQTFRAFLCSDERFADMTFRESMTTYQPFKLMKVKLKKEIITMHKPDVRPEITRAPSIAPAELKQWLDQKRDITILDTRNDYEVRFGTFDNAMHFQLADFGEFPAASEALPQNKPIVMFCTGGIRCEKAALHLLNAGFPEVYQLEGGILNYFAEVGEAHYHGECFVFDQRVSVNPQLQESGAVQCVGCQGPVSIEQQTSIHYRAGECCPQCINQQIAS